MGNIIVRILGALDLLSAIVFLSFIFGAHPFLQLILFCSGLLLLKGMFTFTGDILSVIDLFSSICLLILIFFMLPVIILWICAFLLLAKGIVSLI